MFDLYIQYIQCMIGCYFCLCAMVFLLWFVTVNLHALNTIDNILLRFIFLLDVLLF